MTEIVYKSIEVAQQCINAKYKIKSIVEVYGADLIDIKALTIAHNLGLILLNILRIEL